MKEVCKNCRYCQQTYKGGYCTQKEKKIKLTGTCGKWEIRKA